MIIDSPVISGSAAASFRNVAITGSLGVTGSIITTGTITAQTLVVQTVTSSVIYSSGSNVFGNNIANTQVLTGSVTVTGSLAVITNGTEFQVTSTGVNLGNALTDSHVISGSLRVNPNGLFVSSSGNIGINYTAQPNIRTFIYDNSANYGLVVQQDGSGTIAQFSGNSGAVRMYISSSGNVGIGTSAPIYNDIVMPYAKTATSTVASFFIRSNEAPASNPFGLRFQLIGSSSLAGRYATLQTTDYNSADGGSLILQPGGGTVGIGTTTPGNFFEAYGTLTTNIAYFTTSGSANRMILGTKNYGNNSLIDIRAHGSTYTETVLGNSMTNAVGVVGYTPSLAPMVVGTTTNSPLVFGINNQEVMRISGSNVGIGTTTPGSKLAISGGDLNIQAGTLSAFGLGLQMNSTFTFSGTAYRTAIFSYNTGDGNGIQLGYDASAGTGIIAASTNGSGAATAFWTYNGSWAERMRITKDGNVGVNTAGSICKFVVADTGAVITSGDVTFDTQAKGIELYNNTSGTTDNLVGYWFSVGPHKSGIASGRTNAGGGWELDLRFFTHGSVTSNLNHTYENMRLYGNGNLTINGSLTQNGGLSDINLKENLTKITSPLEKISQINGYNFDWKKGTPPNGEMLNIVHDAGLIAQEVAEVMPDIVRENKWDGTKMLNYNGVIALLVEGMKELQSQIDELKNK